MAVLLDTFTEASDTALGSHTPDTRPGSETWAVAGGGGGITVIGASDHATQTATGENTGALNYATDGGTRTTVECDVTLPASAGTIRGGPALYLSSGTPSTSGMIGLSYAHELGYFSLYYEGPTDSFTQDTYVVSRPASATLLLERDGNTVNGYVDGTLRCTLDLSGTTDFLSATTMYPGIRLLSTSGGNYSAVDNFEVLEHTDVAASSASLTLTTYGATITAPGGSDVNVSASTAVLTLSTHSATVSLTTAALVVGGTTISVAIDAPDIALEPLVPDAVPMANGTLLSGITSTRGYTNALRLRTPPLTSSQLTTQEAALTTGIPVACTGWLVGGAMTAIVENVSVSRAVPSLYYVITFELREAA